MKSLLLRILYHVGLLGLFHRLRNRESLTVVLFHRVLPMDALPLEERTPWIVTPRTFDSYLAFFRRHYHLVTLNQVLDSVHGGAPLPPCALLVSFDDGYVDNLTIAAPILRRHQAPAVLFAVGGAFDGTELWQEAAARLWRLGLLTPAHCAALWAAAAPTEPAPGPWTHGPSVTLLLARLEHLSPDQRLAAFTSCGAPLPQPYRDCLMRPAQLQEWVRAGFDIGSHGASHHPLPLTADQEAELRLSRQRLLDILAPLGQSVDTISWPHGRCNPDTLPTARNAGYRLFFNSHVVTNRAPAGRPDGNLGRYEPSADALENGLFRPERAARYLFFLPLASDLQPTDPGRP